MRFLIIDNYDSFVHNIAQALGGLGVEVDVVRNDGIGAGEIARRGYDAIVISPGPGTPESERDFGVSREAIERLGRSTPILGVCLGHQGIICAFGGRVKNASRVRHGKTSPVAHRGGALFEGVASPFRATRYHSLVGESTAIPDSLEVTAVAEDDGEVMAVRHRELPIYGVQFHPESIMTPEGRRILANFVRIVGGRR